MSKMIMVDSQPIKFQIWDTAGIHPSSKTLRVVMTNGLCVSSIFAVWRPVGQEKYHSLAPMYYRGAAAAIIVYDLTRAVNTLPLTHLRNC